MGEKKEKKKDKKEKKDKEKKEKKEKATVRSAPDGSDKKWPKLQKQRSEDRGKEKLEFCLAEKKRPRSKFSLVGKKERKASLVGGEQNAT